MNERERGRRRRGGEERRRRGGGQHVTKKNESDTDAVKTRRCTHMRTRMSTQVIVGVGLITATVLEVLTVVEGVIITMIYPISINTLTKRNAGM